MREGGAAPGYNPELFKELPGTYIHPLPVEVEVTLAAQSLYGLWWRFLRRSTDYPPSADLLANPVRAGVFRDFGELGDWFGSWWHGRGRDLFKERGDLPLVRALMPNALAVLGEREIALAIPVNVSRDLLLQQVDLLLAQFHEGPALERHRYSTARRRLFPKPRYHLDRYLNMIDALDLHREQPRLPLHAIAEELGINAAKNMPLDGDSWEVAHEKRERSRKSVQNLLRSAEIVAHNAALGVFPYEQRRMSSAEAARMLPTT